MRTAAFAGLLFVAAGIACSRSVFDARFFDTGYGGPYSDVTPVAGWTREKTVDLLYYCRGNAPKPNLVMAAVWRAPGCECMVRGTVGGMTPDQFSGGGLAQTTKESISSACDAYVLNLAGLVEEEMAGTGEANGRSERQEAEDVRVDAVVKKLTHVTHASTSARPRVVSPLPVPE